VLDQQDCVLLLQRTDQLDHARGLLGTHTGERLVEQQHLRIGRERHRDFELALLTVRQHRRARRLASPQPRGLERAPRAAVHRVVTLGAPPESHRAR